MDKLSEIRQRVEAVKTEQAKGNAIDCACLSWVIVLNDVPYLLAEIERLNDELYDADGVNLVKYWHQQCQIQENGLCNYGKVCAVYRASAEKAGAERDAAIGDWKVYEENGQCDVCKYGEGGGCVYPEGGRCHFEWRGPQEAGEGGPQ